MMKKNGQSTVEFIILLLPLMMSFFLFLNTVSIIITKINLEILAYKIGIATARAYSDDDPSYVGISYNYYLLMNNEEPPKEENNSDKPWWEKLGEEILTFFTETIFEALDEFWSEGKIESLSLTETFFHEEANHYIETATNNGYDVVTSVVMKNFSFNDLISEFSPSDNPITSFRKISSGVGVSLVSFFATMIGSLLSMFQSLAGAEPEPLNPPDAGDTLVTISKEVPNFITGGTMELSTYQRFIIDPFYPMYPAVCPWSKDWVSPESGNFLLWMGEY